MIADFSDFQKLVSNAGILVAASAFVATVNKDMFERERASGPEGAGARPYVHRSRLAQRIRSTTIWVGIVLGAIMAGLLLLQVEPVYTWVSERLTLPIGVWHCVVWIQTLYYFILCSIIFRTCQCRGKASL